MDGRLGRLQPPAALDFACGSVSGVCADGEGLRTLRGSADGVPEADPGDPRLPQLPRFAPQAVRRQPSSSFCRVLRFPPLLTITRLNVNVLGTGPSYPCAGPGSRGHVGAPGQGGGAAGLRPLSRRLRCPSPRLPADGPQFRFRVG